MTADAVFDRAPDDTVRVLDTDGEVVEGATVPDLADEELVAMYREMRLSRRFDERAISLQRQGRIGTYPSLAGQEGAQIGGAHALRADDWVCYQYREHGIVAVRGLAPEYLRYWMGDELGNAWLTDRAVFPINIGIGSQIPHATGLAMAAKHRGDDTVVCCHFGDGATSEGDFHEGLNFAGVYDVPAVFVCNNNQWAISVPRERQTRSATFAQKATAYGFEGVQVDGMDPLATYRVTKAAVEKARATDGERPRPTLIEAVQYRFGAHTTSDDPDAYREEAEVEAWREKDPIPRMERFLRKTGRLDDERVAAIEAEIEEVVADVVEGAEAMEVDPVVMFEHAYDEPTPRLREQRDYLAALRERHGDDALLEEDG
jgi:pyruvate dehydrogenase E1 component alpha subunit